MLTSRLAPGLPSQLRRRVLKGLAAFGTIASGGLPARALAQLTGDSDVLSGKAFHLTIGATGVNVTGAQRVATAVNGRVPAPTLMWTEGDLVTLHVTNLLDTPSSIHWHGVLVPADMDGVPGLSFPGIAPGQTFTYRFPVKQSGTYWYHSHSRFQEQTGLYGAIVIAPKSGERIPADRDYVVMLSDWTDGVPERIFADLKKMSDFFNANQPTLGDLVRDVRSMGWAAALDKRKMWNRMRMMPTDFSDVTASRNVTASLHYLINGQIAARNWTGLFRPGERVRLRFINGSATTIFDVRIPGLKLNVVAADGQDVEPVTVDEFRISVAETYDVIVEPDDQAYTVFAQSIDRTGFVRGTLAPRAGMQAPVPAVDPPQWLEMVDMMGAMAMGGNGHGAMHRTGPGPAGADSGEHSPMDHSQMDHSRMDQSRMNPNPMDHSQMDHSQVDHSQMDHSQMDHSQMDHSQMDQSQMKPSQMDHSQMQMSHGQMGHTAMDPNKTNHNQKPPSQTAAPGTMPGMAMGASAGAAPPQLRWERGAPVGSARHARTEYTPNVDMHVDMPRTNLDDPGINLRGNGRRVLTYADLRTVGGSIDRRAPSRDIELHLTGNMERFVWSFDGQKFSESKPVHFRHGERLRIVLVNDTMMNHPIHLHGMWGELESPEGDFLVRKHTFNVQPAQRIAYRVTADALGHWAYHCHLLYHMEAGMFREVIVS